ncbi:MAG: NifU family protein [Alphaproteobacteria bacterium]|nr:NifU family protein [Alphaproteobacteria bacterium]USO07473.1 MAG: NifU family protein [Rhodospirillales bacterium]
MFIQTEATPNPDAIKFIPGTPVAPGGSFDYRMAADADKSPLARRLFKIAGVDGVYLGHDFVSVTKAADDDWAVLKPRILAAIMDHALSGLPTVEGVSTPAATQNAEDGEVVAQIRDILDERVRPAVAMDGGDIVFDRFEDGVVYLHMRGACSGCPSATATLKNGIENMLRHFVPEVREVRPA